MSLHSSNEGSFRGLITEVLARDVKISEFNLRLRYYTAVLLESFWQLTAKDI